MVRCRLFHRPSMMPTRRLSDPISANGRSIGCRETFSAIARRILGTDGTVLDKRDASNDLYTVFNELAGRPQERKGAEANPWQTETLLACGKAVNPYTAVNCLLDGARTRAFAQGVHQAIRAARERFPGEPVELLYAGTGPFAPLALLQTVYFSPQELRLTLIDIHQPALDCLKGILAALGLDDYVAALCQADATQWVPAPSKTYHILVAEIMDRGLSTEPQVAATMHLVQFLRPGGFVVPECVELRLCLSDRPVEMNRLEGNRLAEDLPDPDRSRQMLGFVFALTGLDAKAYSVTGDGRIPLAHVRLPSELLPNGQLNILTTIRTFGDIRLDEHESVLTKPMAADVPCGLQPAMVLAPSYRLSNNPGLEFHVVTTETPPLASLPDVGFDAGAGMR